MTARKPLEWRGIELPPVEHLPRVWQSMPIELDDRGADWRVEQPLEGGAFHARLRIGADRFPGVGKTAPAALEAAAGEACNAPRAASTRSSGTRGRKAIKVRRR